MAKTKTRTTRKRKAAKASAARPERPTGRRLNLRIRTTSYDHLCTMALDDDLTVTAWLVRMIDREYERRDLFACTGEVGR